MPDALPMMCPEDPLLARIETLLREGLPPALEGEEWTTGPAPEGHWLFPAGTRFYRGDSAEEVKAPAVIAYFQREPEPYARITQRYWKLYPAIWLVWNRDLLTEETPQLQFVVGALLTQDMTAPVAEGNRNVLARLSLAPTDDAPGVNVLSINAVEWSLDKSTAGRPEMMLSFEVLCEALAPTGL